MTDEQIAAWMDQIESAIVVLSLPLGKEIVEKIVSIRDRARELRTPIPATLPPPPKDTTP